MILYGHSQAIAEWVASLIDYVDDFGTCEALGVLSREGTLIAGVVYSEYQPRYGTIQISIASVSPMWARRENIRELLAYPFDQLGVYKAWTTVPIDNEASRKATKHIGFRQEAILAHQYGPKRHAIIHRMTKPDFRRMYGAS